MAYRYYLSQFDNRNIHYIRIFCKSFYFSQMVFTPRNSISNSTFNNYRPQASFNNNTRYSFEFSSESQYIFTRYHAYVDDLNNCYKSGGVSYRDDKTQN